MRVKEKGYFGIGVYLPKNVLNIGTLWRSAHNFGASFIFTIGQRYKRQPSDVQNAQQSVPMYCYSDIESLRSSLPSESLLVAIEQHESSKDLKSFQHPERSIYLLGAEDEGLPEEVLKRCHRIVSIDTPQCLNVAVAGSIVMFDRSVK